jgi:hypothetical protein
MTCEGRYKIIYLYHIHLLPHLKDISKNLNLPFFLLKTLVKIVGSVKNNPPNKDKFLYHHALVKFIVLYEIRKLNQTWEEFLERNGFQEEINVEVNHQIPENHENHGNLERQQTHEIHEILEIH